MTDMTFRFASKAAVAAMLLPFAAGAAVAQSATADPSASQATGQSATAGSSSTAAGVDTNGDGKPDAWDRDSNGTADAWDTNGDGKPDAYDSDGDGKPDAAAPGSR